MIAIFPEIVGSVAVKDFEMLAVLVRKYFGGDEKFNPRISLDTLIKRVGIKSGKDKIDYRAVLVAKDEKGKFEVASIVSESRMSESGRRFLLAHQLGHYFLHIQPHIARGEWRANGFTENILPNERYEKDLSDSRLSLTQEEKEKDADEFAICLLMPLGMAKKAQEKLGDVAKIADFFGVNVQTAARRLEAISGHETQPRNFIAAEKEIDPALLATTADTGVKMTTEQLAESIKVHFNTESEQAKNKSTFRSGMDRIRELARKIDPGV